MAIFLKILTTIFGIVGFFFFGLFILACIGSVVNPQLETVGEKVVDWSQRTALLTLAIASVFIALFIVLI